MIRIAHISDSHFDHSSRWEETLRIHQWIADDIRARGVDLITHGGDLFHARPNPEEWRAAAEWLRSLADIAEVVGVYGNHDVASSLAVYPFVRAGHPITIYDAPTVHRVGELSIACLPWPRKAALLAALGEAVPPEQVSQAALTAMRDILAGFAHADGERVFLGHCMVRGSRLHSGQPLAPGSDFEIGLEDLALARANAYLFGHVHAMNRYMIGGAPGIMPGAPRHTTFGEPGETFYAIVTLDGGKAHVELVETPATRMLLFEAEWNGTALVGLHRFADVAGAECRLRYHVPADQREAAAARAKEDRDIMIANGAVVVRVEEVVEAAVRARVPEVAAAVTLDDKLRALWRAKGIELGDREPRVLGRLAELEMA